VDKIRNPRAVYLKMCCDESVVVRQRSDYTDYSDYATGETTEESGFDLQQG